MSRADEIRVTWYASDEKTVKLYAARAVHIKDGGTDLPPRRFIDQKIHNLGADADEGSRRRTNYRVSKIFDYSNDKINNKTASCRQCRLDLRVYYNGQFYNTHDVK